MTSHLSAPSLPPFDHEPKAYEGPSYEEVKQMRSNIPKLQYLYLVLRQSGGVKKYLEYFREHANEFKTYRDQLHKFTQTLYLNYVDCFIKKKAE